MANAVATNALGLIEQGNNLEDQGLLDKALRCYEAAIRIAPELSRAHLNRGNVLLAKDDTPGAIAAYLTALEHKPDYAAAHYNLGNAYAQSGQLGRALAAYGVAIELNSTFTDAHIARANVLSDLGRLAEAATGYRRALALAPMHAEIHYLLGGTLKKLGRLDEAIHAYRRATEIRPDLVEAHASLGNLLQDLGRLEEAAGCYHRALALKPDFFEVMGNLGNLLKDVGQLEGAIASYRQLLELKPDSAEAYSNLGIVMAELGRFESAMTNYRKAIELDPGLAIAHNNLGAALKDIGQFENAEECFRKALALDPDSAEANSNLLFLHTYQANKSPEVCLEDARRYGAIVARRVRRYETWNNERDPERRLRVGLVSGDFCDHPVGHFIEGVLAALAAGKADRLEIFGYYGHFNQDTITQRIKAHCRGWCMTVGLSDELLAKRIHDDGIDVLLDLSGHTKRNRLPVFAWKAAPVQVTWLGYLATTGVEAIDYLIADDWTLLKTEEAYFTETIWRLPETYVCFTPQIEIADVGPLPALAHGYVTFGSFNNLAKMNDEVVALWARILNAVPASRLFLKAKQLTDSSVRRGVVERFGRHGVSADRLMLEMPVARAEYLKPFRRMDIAVDPFPYQGITTTVESLMMGVPVLSLSGKSYISRQGVGLLMNAGLPEWIAVDADDYVARAVRYAGDLPRLGALRGVLQRQVLSSPIFDAPRFAGHFEAALRGMWRKWCS